MAAEGPTDPESPEAADTPKGEALSGDRTGSSDFADALEDASGNSGGTDPEGPASTTGAAAPGAQAVLGAANAAWRVQILEQVAVRDQKLRGVEELFEQYSECLRGLQIARHSAAGSLGQEWPCAGSTGPSPSPSGSASPSMGPRTGPSLPSQEDLELTRAASDAVRGQALAQAQATAQELRKRLALSLRAKEQELEALQKLLVEREEELREKEQAHTAVCRQATLLGRENAELKAQLERTQQQLQAKSSETDRLLSELTRLREAEAARMNGGGGERPACEAPELPTKQRFFRKIHEAELTCIAAAGMQGAPLPKNLVAIGTSDGYVKLLDGTTARLHAHLSVSRDLPRLVAVDLSPGSGLLLAASSDHAMRLLDLRAQRLLHTLRGHLGPLSACGFLRAGSHAFTASADRTVKLWDLARGQTLRSTPASGPVTAAAVHPSSGVIVTGHADGSLAMWDPRVSDALSVPMAGHGDRAVVGLRLSPDGRFVLSQADDGTVCHTALDKMQTLLSLDGLGPVSAPSPPAYSPDGAHILARGTGSLRCWSASAGDCSCEHQVQAPLCVCWDLPQAVSAHEEGHVALWGAAEGT
uniref:Autophagy-related protein 16 domain-containing protein n=1 Tax=Alexandrium monilatum TaxID=311494 RepID=A0A7S4V4I9_9DINO